MHGMEQLPAALPNPKSNECIQRILYPAIVTKPEPSKTAEFDLLLLIICFFVGLRFLFGHSIGSPGTWTHPPDFEPPWRYVHLGMVWLMKSAEMP